MTQDSHARLPWEGQLLPIAIGRDLGLIEIREPLITEAVIRGEKFAETRLLFTHEFIEEILGLAGEAAKAGLRVASFEGEFQGGLVMNLVELEGYDEAGGLSGAPLLAPSTEILRQMHRRLGGRVGLIGVGGIASGADAYAKIRAGACLLQLYTALVYSGPGLVGRIKRELAALLARDGFSSLSQAVGTEP